MMAFLMKNQLHLQNNSVAEYRSSVSDDNDDDYNAKDSQVKLILLFLERLLI